MLIMLSILYLSVTL